MSREDEIRERLEAATPGPWVDDGGEVTTDLGPYDLRYPTDAPVATVIWPVDGDLIVNSPTDIAYLLDRIKELEAEK